MADGRAPLWARALALLTPAVYRRDILDDLLEESAGHGRGRRRSRLWLAAHLLRSAVASRWRANGSRHIASPLVDAVGEIRGILRSWRRHPTMPLTAITTIAIGLGLATAIFAFADGYLFRPLPFREPDQLYGVFETNFLHAADADQLRRGALAPFGFVEWSVARAVGGTLDTGDRRIVVLPYGASPGFSETMRVPLALGRWFTAEDYAPATIIPAWLSHKLWAGVFNSAPDIIGRRLRLLGTVPHEIEVVGVLSPEVASFDLNNEPPDVVVPEPPTTGRGSNSLSWPFVRVPEGLTAAQAAAQIDAAYHALPPPPGADAWTRGAIRLRPLRDLQVAGGLPTARVLFAGALLVLLLVLVNLVQLLLARGAARSGEVALRQALGASRWRLLRLFLAESLLVAATGSAAGLGLGYWLVGIIQSRIPAIPTGGRNLAMVPMIFDVRDVVFIACIGAAMGLVGGLWPAWRAGQSTLAAGRDAGSRIASLKPRLARVLLATELTVATVILTGAVFLGLGIWTYLHQPLGFDYDRRFVVTTPAEFSAQGSSVAAPDLRPLIPALASLPGVRAAGTMAMARGSASLGGVTIGSARTSASAVNVDAGDFATFGVTTLEGRVISADDLRTAARVAVVDEAFAVRYWPRGGALGAQIRVGRESSDRTIVGVVSAIRTRLSAPPSGQVYAPVADRPIYAVAIWAPSDSVSSLRARLDALAGSGSPAGATHFDVKAITLDDMFLRDVGEAEFQQPIMILFAALAFALAGVGLFGLVSFLVEQRLREFGIRVALGARSMDIWRFVAGLAVVPASIGLVVGLPAARVLETLVKSKVFGWEASGTAVAVIVGALLFVVALAAAALPARRAMRVDPVQVLRAD